MDKRKGELIAQLKADGVTYEERIARLDEVTHPQPAAELIWDAFERFRDVHPWVTGDALKPKSIGREMVEEFLPFAEYIRRYGLQRSEGVLLRYLSQLYKTLHQNVPDWAKDEAVWDVVGFLRAMIERVDTSLIEEWESLAHPELILSREAEDSREAHRILAWEELLVKPARLHRAGPGRAAPVRGEPGPAGLRGGGGHDPPRPGRPGHPLDRRVARARDWRRSSSASGAWSSTTGRGWRTRPSSPPTATGSGRWCRCWSTPRTRICGAPRGASTCGPRRASMARWWR